MGCYKTKNRNFATFLTYFSCHNCSSNRQDEIIKIGYQRIYIFFVSNCSLEVYYYYRSERLKLLLKEIILETKEHWFMWLDESEYSRCSDFLPLFLTPNRPVCLVLT